MVMQIVLVFAFVIALVSVAAPIVRGWNLQSLALAFFILAFLISAFAGTPVR